MQIGDHVAARRSQSRDRISREIGRQRRFGLRPPEYPV